jgi:hypothetical protein
VKVGVNHKARAATIATIVIANFIELSLIGICISFKRLATTKPPQKDRIGAKFGARNFPKM